MPVNHSLVNKTLRYRQHVRFINDKRSERFNDPKKSPYKEFYYLVVISYQVRTLTLKTKLHHSDDKENLIKAGVGGGGGLENYAYRWENPCYAHWVTRR